MAKKRAKPAVRENSIRVRMNDDFKEWLERAAANSRISVSSFMELATVDYARRQGFAEKPPER